MNGRYLSTTKTIGITSIDIGTTLEIDRGGKDRDTKHTGHLNNETTQNNSNGKRNVEVVVKDSYASTVGRSGGQDRKLGCHQQLEESDGAINEKK